MTCSVCDLSGKTTTHLGNTDQFIGWSLMMILLLHMIITTYKLRNSRVLSRLGQLYAFLNARTWSRHGNHACCSESWLQFWFDFLKRQTWDGVRQQTMCLGLLDLLMQRFLGPLRHSQLFGDDFSGRWCCWRDVWKVTLPWSWSALCIFLWDDDFW